jgi:gluconolactonase
MATPKTYKTVSKFDWKTAAANPQHFSTLAAKGPAFIVYDSAFEDVIGTEPSLTLVETRSDKFAHEAGVYIQKTDSNYFTSNYQSGKTVEIYSVDSKDHKVVQHSFPDVKNGNGGCWYRDQILFCGQGDLTSPSALVLVDPSTSSSETLINNFHGRPFNSLNDVVVHHANDELWFTGTQRLPASPSKQLQPSPLLTPIQTQPTATSKPSASPPSSPARSTASSPRPAKSGASPTASCNATASASVRTTRRCT